MIENVKYYVDLLDVGERVEAQISRWHDRGITYLGYRDLSMRQLMCDYANARGYATAFNIVEGDFNIIIEFEPGGIAREEELMGKKLSRNYREIERLLGPRNGHPLR